MSQNNTENVYFLNYEIKKRWQFCVLVNVRANGPIFRVIKSFISFIDPILDTLYISFSKNRNFLISLLVDLDSHGFIDYGNMSHYACRIRMLWPLHSGAVVGDGDWWCGWLWWVLFAVGCSNWS